MREKTLHMIGNSHIDPVWFWTWEEGMQEVKSTYSSVLDRMNEFPDFKFTSTSTAFFEWIEQIQPDMFQEIRKRVLEGRWEITGGWFIEPDCILPCGEAFVRQGLYAQRYLQRTFGLLCKTGSNVDSFGHNPTLPQILRKSGMDSYVFMRPRLDTPVFLWESQDKSQVIGISLPGEYTTWFHEPTVENIQNTLDKTKGYENMVCCYGVGNHGGGPTIENIQSIQSLEYGFDHTRLVLSTFTEFLEEIDTKELPIITGAFEKVNPGCYSIDSGFKSLNRLAEKRLLETDVLLTMAKGHTGVWMEEIKEMEKLWKVVLFNQFHDTLGGTIIKEAREEAMMQLSLVCTKASQIKAFAIQHIVNSVDTQAEHAKEGFPLFLFSTGNVDIDEYVEVELSWFCKSPLCLTDSMGKEVPYQRIHTEVKTRNYNIGGRRRIVFRAKVPAYGYTIYRVSESESSCAYNNQMEIENADPYQMENPYIAITFQKETGMISSLVDKSTGYDSCCENASFRLFADERDSWGHIQDRVYEDRKAVFQLESIEKIESGKLREVVRVRTSVEGTRIEQLFILGAKDQEVTVKTRLFFAHTWSLMKFVYPVGKECNHVKVETAYGCMNRLIQDTDEYFMQRFVDASDSQGRGLFIANNGKYSFHMEEGSVQITVARSAIFAQGNSKDWYNEKECYQYHDMGEQEFVMVLRPHGEAISGRERYRLAQKAEGRIEYLLDSIHDGQQNILEYSMAKTDVSNVEVVLLKKAEEDTDTVIRLLEIEGIDTTCKLTYEGKEYPIQISPYSIMTVKINTEKGSIAEVNLLEQRERREDSLRR